MSYFYVVLNELVSSKILSALISRIGKDHDVRMVVLLLFEETRNVGEICVKGTILSYYLTCAFIYSGTYSIFKTLVIKYPCHYQFILRLENH